MKLLKWVDDLPEWSQSRKLLMVLVTFVALIVLAVVGTIMVMAADAPMHLFERAMDYIFGGGSIGVGSQGVVDSFSARSGQYRAPVERVSVSPPPQYAFPGPDTPPSNVAHSIPPPPPSSPTRVPPTFLGK